VLDLQRGIRGDAGCISMTRARVRDSAPAGCGVSASSSSTMDLSSLHFAITIIRPGDLARACGSPDEIARLNHESSRR